MDIQDWDKKYRKILEKFEYSRQQDEASALQLGLALKNNNLKPDHLKPLIAKKPVFVIGASPSLTKSLPILKKHKKITKIVADSAIKFLLENNVHPDIVVTDLDGDEESLLAAAQKSIMIVHAHGDNIEKIHRVKNYPKCMGTTQSKPVGKIQNFGGFTDGDRAVFLAEHFGAKKIILLGMDFGSRVGRHSGTKRSDRLLKLKKLKEAESLISWLVDTIHTTSNDPRIVSTSRTKGIPSITYEDIDNIIT